MIFFFFFEIKKNVYSVLAREKHGYFQTAVEINSKRPSEGGGEHGGAATVITKFKNIHTLT